MLKREFYTVEKNRKKEVGANAYLFGVALLWGYIALHAVCPDCGTRISIKDAYCKGCGKKLSE